MIISDRHKLAFIHIPKCAGSTVRSELASIDERAERYENKLVAWHDALGLIDYHHLPLVYLKDLFRDDFDIINYYQTFALIRDPFDRFPSSMAQRLKMYKETTLEKIAERDLWAEIETVVSSLSKLKDCEPVICHDLIHFARQSDYTHIAGERYVKNIYKVENVGGLLSHVASLVGSDFSANARENTSTRRLSAAHMRIFVNVVRGAVNFIPGKDRRIGINQKINDIIYNKYGEKNLHKITFDAFKSKYVRDFIEYFYKNDLGLLDNFDRSYDGNYTGDNGGRGR